MSDLEKIQKLAAKKADEHTGETDPNSARSEEWHGFFYGYLLGKQEQQANEVDKSDNPALHKQSVNRWVYLYNNYSAILLGFAIAISFTIIVQMFENVIVKIALIINGN